MNISNFFFLLDKSYFKVVVAQLRFIPTERKMYSLGLESRYRGLRCQCSTSLGNRLANILSLLNSLIFPVYMAENCSVNFIYLIFRIVQKIRYWYLMLRYPSSIPDLENFRPVGIILKYATPTLTIYHLFTDLIYIFWVD